MTTPTQNHGTLKLQCKQLRKTPGVHFAGRKRRFGLEAFELIQPQPGTTTLVDRWANGPLVEHKGVRHIEIHDEAGVHTFEARQIDSVIRLSPDNVSFGAYPAEDI